MATSLDRKTVAKVSAEEYAAAEGLSIESNAPLAPPKPNGPVMAAFIASGIASFVLGVLTVAAEASPAIKAFLNWFNPVGPLSGKTGYATIIGFVVFGVLYALWRTKDVNFNRAYALTLVLVGLAFVGTFPLFFEMFTVK